MAAGQTQMSARQLLFSIIIVRMAFIKPSYIYGLVVFMISADLSRMLWFYPIGVFWTLIYWPTRARREKIASKGGEPMSRIFDDDYDLSGIIVRPLYFGLVANIVIPVGLLLVCYYISDSGSIYNRIGTTANPLFYIFAALALGPRRDWPLFLRKKLYSRSMIRRSETFEQDFSDALLQRSRPIFLLIASISIYALYLFSADGAVYRGGLFCDSVVFWVSSDCAAALWPGPETDRGAERAGEEGHVPDRLRVAG